ncbi:hypothetical protein KIN20_000851 [Parelaphostrongylus tenuis]|uniref:Cuticlin N-terminal domain-containing protein n=1 Tax=Parelaphostrongylus tenuis TaxID=148309 RepID=A0AAD5LWY6_PARTN|nr:hypothetical protein KIN20_000851 [Parelaphostrongylus tenuis]
MNVLQCVPVISCERDRIRIEIETSRPFGGKVFVKGEYANRQCIRSYVEGVPSAPHDNRMSPPKDHRSPQYGAKTEIRSSPREVAEHDGTTQNSNQSSFRSLGYDKVRVTDGKAAEEVEDNKLNKANSKWREHNTVGSTTEEITADKNTVSGHHLSDSVWSGYGGVSSAKKNPYEYLGAFGGSHKEKSHPQLKIYSKPKLYEPNNSMNLHQSGSQGLIPLNCPQKCEPCSCSKEEQPQERKRRTTNHVELSVPLGACNAKRDRKYYEEFTEFELKHKGHETVGSVYDNITAVDPSMSFLERKKP